MVSPTTTFSDLIRENKRNSVLLLALFCAFTVIVALTMSLGVIGVTDPESLGRLGLFEVSVIATIALVAALVGASLAYFAGDRLILGVSQAREIHHGDDPELFNVVEEMAIAAGVAMPKVYVIEDSAPNAFATGRDPGHAAIAVTTGLRSKLTRDELQGVIAHEMSHIRNYDIRLMLLMAVLVGTIAILADVFWQVLRSAQRGRRSRRSGESATAGPHVLLIVIAAILLASLAPMLAQIIQLAVSRQREYLADASAVELTRYPQGLASALRKIDADSEVLEVANRGTAHLYIANPIKSFEARAGSIFASHPPIAERIRRLEALTV